ncbi:3077_t:CDS:2 [Gigaspora margarita]|uniref:3077_t:CDS:1 n=1 Tax=Gigaspora margarita TaxID=4874 RepID=A0ABN7VS37_GIGMA|nr:3077_t:CDS:2 [Gigaspora margarita]
MPLSDKGVGTLASDNNLSSNYVPNLDEVIDVDEVIQSCEIKGNVKKERGKRGVRSNKKASGCASRSLCSSLKSCSSDVVLGRNNFCIFVSLSCVLLLCL